MLGYCNTLFKTFSQYQKKKKKKKKKKKWLEKLLQSCAGFVKCKYGCKNEVIDLRSARRTNRFINTETSI